LPLQSTIGNLLSDFATRRLWQLAERMPLYWLCYRHNNQISVVIEPAASLVHARMHAAIAGLEGELTEGYALPWKGPKAMIGRRLSQDEAKRLLAKFE